MLASILVGETEAFTGLDRIGGTTVFSLIVFEQLLPAQGRGLGLLCGLLAERGQRIHVKITVAGVFLFEVILGFDFRIALSKHLLEAVDNLNDVNSIELGTDPNDEMGYSPHKFSFSFCAVETTH